MNKENLNKKIQELENKIDSMSKPFSLIYFIRSHKKFINFCIVMLILSGLVAHATFTIPNTFSDGQVISATEINDNFSAVVNAINNSGETIVMLNLSTPYSLTSTDGTYDSMYGYMGYNPGWNGNKVILFNNVIDTLSTIQVDGTSGGSYFTTPSDGWYEFYVNFEFNRTTAEASWGHKLYVGLYKTTLVADLASTGGTSLKSFGYTDESTPYVQSTPGEKLIYYLKSGDIVYINTYFEIEDNVAGNSADTVGLGISDTQVAIKKITL